MLTAPKTPKDTTSENLHGTLITDAYRWLENSSDPEVQLWLRQHAERSSEYFQNLPIRNQLRDELESLNRLDTIGMPRPRNGRYFFSSRKADQDMSIFYVKEWLNGVPRVLIDQNTLSPDKTTTLSGTMISRNGKLVAYMLSSAGNDKLSIHVMDVDTGEDLPDMIPDDIYPRLEAWNQDGSGFWYGRRDPAAPPEEAKFHKRIFFHKLGDNPKDDQLVFGKELGKESIPNIGLSLDGKYLLAGVFGQEEGQEWTEVFLKDLENPEGNFVQVIARKLGSEYRAHIHRDTLYIYTNDEAPNWKLQATSVADALSGKMKCTTLIPEGKCLLEGYELIGDSLFVNLLENVHAVVRQYDLEGTYICDIELPTLGSVGGFTYEAEGKECFFGFNSFAYPPSIFRLNLDTNEVTLFDQMKSPFDVEMLQTEQVWYSSKDGTHIPMFLVHKKGLVKNGDNPTMVYGYGGFDVSLSPGFLVDAIPFIKRGGIYAIVNLRGGGEFGREWHEAGMKTNKQNVFDDFIAAIEWLIKEKYTCTERVAIMGGSNGGLLVTAILTQRPDLVRAVVSQVPVTDMLRFHLHHGGRHWIPDYGDPDDPDMFKYLLGYSPYHNVCDGQDYPATLIMTSDGDDRVHPLHSYKMAARLLEANNSQNPILLRVELKAGHGGASAVSKGIEQEADLWAFVFDQLKMVD
jgi:prolyl oligopeptidase